ncbi:hypothetical protein CSUI_002048 [Cystoisospora suis]|uniref:Uncharacterized protein n=1 Tax=Cystoisospora suis TaxID=483139 RepID=A0A2C6LAD3_9APIC|nr:hypothetical protein CSUI_002048 [Cystoisospora suis]
MLNHEVDTLGQANQVLVTENTHMHQEKEKEEREAKQVYCAFHQENEEFHKQLKRLEDENAQLKLELQSAREEAECALSTLEAEIHETRRHVFLTATTASGGTIRGPGVPPERERERFSSSLPPIPSPSSTSMGLFSSSSSRNENRREMNAKNEEEVERKCATSSFPSSCPLVSLTVVQQKGEEEEKDRLESSRRSRSAETRENLLLTKDVWRGSSHSKKISLSPPPRQHSISSSSSHMTSSSIGKGIEGGKKSRERSLSSSHYENKDKETKILMKNPHSHPLASPSSLHITESPDACGWREEGELEKLDRKDDFFTLPGGGGEEERKRREEEEQGRRGVDTKKQRIHTDVDEAIGAEDLIFSLRKQLKEATTAAATKDRILQTRIRSLEKQLENQRDYYHKRLSARAYGSSSSIPLPSRRPPGFMKGTKKFQNGSIPTRTPARRLSSSSSSGGQALGRYGCEERRRRGDEEEEAKEVSSSSSLIQNSREEKHAPTEGSSSFSSSSSCFTLPSHREMSEEEVKIKRWLSKTDRDERDLEGASKVSRRREREDMEVVRDLQRREHIFPFLYRDNKAMATLFSFWVLGERFYFKELQSRHHLKSIGDTFSSSFSSSSSSSRGERLEEDKGKNTESFSSSSFSKVARDRYHDSFENDVSLETRLELLVSFLFHNSSSCSSENERCYASSRSSKKPFSSVYQEKASLFPREEATNESEIGFYVFERACERVGCLASEAELLAAWEVLAGPQGGGSERKEEGVEEKTEEERKKRKMMRDSSSLLQLKDRSIQGVNRWEEEKKNRGHVMRAQENRKAENEEGDHQREEEIEEEERRRRRSRHLEEVKQWKVSRSQILIRAKQTEPSFVFLTYCTLLRRVKFQRRELEILTRSNRALLNVAEENQALLLEQQALQKEEREEEQLKHQRHLHAVVSYLLNEKERLLLLPPHSSSSSSLSLLPPHLFSTDLFVQSSLQNTKKEGEDEKAEEEERSNAPSSAFKKTCLTKKTSSLSKEEIVEHPPYRNSEKSKIDIHTQRVVDSIDKIYYDVKDIHPHQHKGNLQANLKSNDPSATSTISSSSFLPSSSSSCTFDASRRVQFSSSHLSSLPSRMQPSPFLSERRSAARQEETQRRGRSEKRRSDFEQEEEKQEAKDQVYEVGVEEDKVRDQEEEMKKKIMKKKDLERDDKKTSPRYGISSSSTLPNYPFFYRKEEGEQGLYGKECSRLSFKARSSFSYREDRETKDKRDLYSYHNNERISSVSPVNVRNERRRGEEEEGKGREISSENLVDVRLGGEKNDFFQDEEKKFVSPPSFSSQHLLNEKSSPFYAHRQNSNEVKPSSSSLSQGPSSHIFQRGIGRTSSSSSASSSYGYTSLLREANESLQHELRLLREEKEACCSSSSHYARYPESKGQPPSSHALRRYSQHPDSYHENGGEGKAPRRREEEEHKGPCSSFSSGSSSSSYPWVEGEAGRFSSNSIKAGYEEDTEERGYRRKEPKDKEEEDTCQVGGDTQTKLCCPKLPLNQSPEMILEMLRMELDTLSQDVQQKVVERRRSISRGRGGPSPPLLSRHSPPHHEHLSSSPSSPSPLPPPRPFQ